ncbi:MAG: PAS domain-containing protein [Alphaproteobacteria bacterium]|jgi:hypothetical protein|nr:PAS domain-containing protein [Alphaproteobacteria bacterium]
MGEAATLIQHDTTTGDASEPDRPGDPDGLDRIARRPGLAGVLDYWQDRHHAGAPPTRREIDPADLVSVLPNVMLVETIEDDQGPTLRFRLVGTGINQAYGAGELTGRTCRDTTTPADHATILGDVARAIATGRPNLRDRTVERPGDQVRVIYSRLLLPLAPLPGEPQCLMVVVDTMTADT